MVAKKNDEIQETPSFRKWLVANFFVMAGILMAVVNLFLATKLSPLYQDITLIKSQVTAIEVKADNSVSRNEFTLVNERLDRIQSGVDRLVELHFIK